MDNKKHLASLAKSIQDNEAVTHAIAQMRSDVLEDLATIDPTDTKEIMARQSDVRAIDSFPSKLADYIREGKDRNPNGIV